MTSWNRRLNAAATRASVAKLRPRAELLADAVVLGISEDDQAALYALATIARDRPRFRKVLAVGRPGGPPDEFRFEIRVDEVEGPMLVRVDGGAPAPAAAPPSEAAGEASDGAAPPEAGLGGNQIVQVLTDTLVETPDIVAIFAGVGQEALWANDAFATMIPVREADRLALVDLLDEWSRGNYEVKVLPALVKYGRWRGRLTLLSGDGDLPVSAVVVAHRDREGDIEAVCMVARDLSELRAAEARADATEARLAALVEHASELIAVVSRDGIVQYASPATTRILGLDDGALAGSQLLDLVHSDDRPERFADLARPDELGLGSPVEMRLRDASGGWRHLEVVATDLTENPAIGGVVLNARDVTQRVEAITQLAGRAFTDPLTDLPNRVRILDRVAQALTDPGSVSSTALVLIGLDGFKAVNERLGGEAGNAVLRQVAERLRGVAGPEHTVGRLGSDEFVILLRRSEGVAEALNVAGRVRNAVALAIPLDEGPVNLTASIGVALARADEQPEELLRDADRALTHAKVQGRDRVELYDEELERVTAHRRQVEDRLRETLDDESLQMHFQPIVEASDPSVVVGAEALLRVHDEEGSLLSPAELVEAAESSGLLTLLGSQILSYACEQLAAWGSDGGAGPLSISVNVSPRQLADADLPNQVVHALDSANLSPDRLCLEITESILIGAQPTVDASIQYLRTLGVRIGLDDFGAGQSSLGYLKRFPLDFVKIDRSLIAGLGRNEADTAIVRATIELCRTIGLSTTAVGVETAEQLEYLQFLGVDRIQGYLYSPPLPPPEVAARIERGYPG